MKISQHDEFWEVCLQTLNIAKREQEKDTGVPPRYAIRLEDLRAWHRIEAACFRCNRKRTLKLPAIMRGRPPRTRLVDLERKLRCTRCGRRGDHVLTVIVVPSE
jgi:hypothetical protein